MASCPSRATTVRWSTRPQPRSTALTDGDGDGSTSRTASARSGSSSAPRTRTSRTGSRGRCTRRATPSPTAAVLGDCLEALRVVALLASPLIPNAAGGAVATHSACPAARATQRLPGRGARGAARPRARRSRRARRSSRARRRDVTVDRLGRLPLSRRITGGRRRARSTGPAAAGVEWMVCVGTDLATSRRGDRARRAPPRRARRPSGLHPHDASKLAAEWDALVALASNPTRASAIGETGFDFYYEHSPRDEQEAAFRCADRSSRTRLGLAARDPLARRVGRHVPRARRRGRSRAHGVPLLHRRTRRSAPRARPRRATCRSAASCRSRTPTTCARRRGSHPIDRMLVETDAPYLAPVPHRGQAERAGLS